MCTQTQTHTQHTLGHDQQAVLHAIKCMELGNQIFDLFHVSLTKMICCHNPKTVLPARFLIF